MISRREILGMLGASAIAADGPPRFTAIDHVEFFASDVNASVRFYSRIFGNTVLKNNRTTRRYIKLGSAYIAIDTGQQIRVDHFCAGIPGFQVAAMHSYLTARGIEYRDYPSGRDLSVADPDGARMQLASDHGWDALLNGTAAPEAIQAPAGPVFQALGLDHILLNVSDPAKAAAFYEKILGPVSQRNNNRIWFQAGTSRLGLLQTPAGQRAGVNHFCVLAAKFDFGAAVNQLKQAGAKMENTEVAGAPEFRDPDGYLVQVTPARA